MSSTVVVDFGVNTDANGEIRVFGQSQPTITNKVAASTKLNLSLLFATPESALIEFQGVDNDISARLESVFTSNEPGATARKNALADAIHSCLTSGNLDASAADPFNASVVGVAKYTDESYVNYSSFGSLALGAYSHYLFGHVDATAAIDNDTTFIEKMNGRVLASGHADLANKLAEAIFTMSSENATAIAKQVIGQDASRAFGVDNDNQGVDGWQKLAFKAGDKIYVSVTLTEPTVSVTSNNAAQQTEPASTKFLPTSNLVDKTIKYMIEIELSA